MNSFFQKLTNFLEQEVVPIANHIDEEEVLFRDIYDRFVQLGGLHLLIPRDLGGLGGERREWIEYNILIAQYSGALLFLQAQHQFCISRLKKLLPHTGVEKLLRSFTSNNQGIGLALQKNKNLLRVEKVPEGYRLSGKFLWATGFGFFSHLLISFEHEEKLFYTLIPFQAEEKKGSSIRLSSKIETAVFNAIPTHSVLLDRWLITTSHLLAMHPVPPKAPVEHPVIYNFAGVSKALLQLTLQGSHGSTPEILESHAALEKKWNIYYQQILGEISDPLAMRVEGLRLAEECALLARLACGAAGILKDHPMNRLLREIWQYTVASYSQEQRQAYLRDLPFS